MKLPIVKRRHSSNRREFAIPRVSFRRLVEEIAGEFKSDLRFQPEAIEALQASAEDLLSTRFARCSQLVELCKRDTVREEHWNFVQDDASACTGAV